MKQKISENVIKRMPRYVRQLDMLLQQGTEKVSSRELSRQMGLTASQIRQDFNCFGGFGQQGYGYNVRLLRDGIAEVLSIDRDRTLIVIGAGNLGRALIANFNFGKCGCRLLAAFDTSEELIGSEVSGTPVLPIGELEDFVRCNNVDIAVLTLPKAYAPDTAKRLERAGIRGIWNFTSADIQAQDSSVEIETVSFSDSLRTLCYYLGVGEDGEEQKL